MKYLCINSIIQREVRNKKYIRKKENKVKKEFDIKIIYILSNNSF